LIRPLFFFRKWVAGAGLGFGHRGLVALATRWCSRQKSHRATFVNQRPSYISSIHYEPERLNKKNQLGTVGFFYLMVEGAGIETKTFYFLYRIFSDLARRKKALE
jgi:hypothetical protein